jgi:ribose 5-phosphate isomerase
VGTGSTLKAAVEQAQAGSGFKIEYSPGGYSSSDHTSFVAKKIPVLFFFSGLHSDYHKPSDTWDKIDPVGGPIAGNGGQNRRRTGRCSERPRFPL